MKINSFKLYIAFWTFNFISNTLSFPKGLVKVNSIIFLVWSFYYLYQVNKVKSATVYIKGLNLMVLMITIYGISLILSDEIIYNWDHDVVANYGYLIQHMHSLLPIYALYYFANNGCIHQGNVKKVFFLFFACYLLEYFNPIISEQVEQLSDRTNNNGYLLVSLIPMFFLFKLWNKFKILFLLLIFLFIIYSAKRGAILTGAIAITIYYLFNKRNITVLDILFVMVVSVASFYIVLYFAENNYALNDKIERTVSGNLSGRDEIYSNFFNYYISQDNFNLILWGNGADSCIRLFRCYAHNDWLEIAIGQGLLGVILYLYYWYSFFSSSLKIKITSFKNSAFTTAIVYFLISLFSMSISDIPFAASFVIGYSMGANHNEIKNLES